MLVIMVSAASAPVNAKQKPKQMMKIGNEVVTLECGKTFVQAQEYITAGQFDQAAPLLEVFLKSVPNSFAGHFKYGFVLLQQGKNAEALEQAKRCTELAPSFAGGWSLLGEASLNLKMETQARECFQKSIALEPQGENADIMRERLAELAGKKTEQLANAEDPTSAEQNRKNMKLNQALSLCNKASEHLKLKQFDQGLEECRAALKIAPDSDQVKENYVGYLNNYAADCVQHQNIQQAELLMKEAVELQSQSGITRQTRSTALKNYSALLNFLNRKDEAKKIEAQMNAM